MGLDRKRLAAALDRVEARAAADDHDVVGEFGDAVRDCAPCCELLYVAARPTTPPAERAAAEGAAMAALQAAARPGLLDAAEAAFGRVDRRREGRR
jgi:hypothetical protein